MAPPSTSAQSGPEDIERIERFLGELSDDARSFRFFSAATDIGQMARLFTDTRGGTSLLAVTSDDGQGRRTRPVLPGRQPAARRVAFAVADDWQGRGIATLLLAQLAEAAAAEGVRQFTAVVHDQQPQDDRDVPRLRIPG